VWHRFTFDGYGEQANGRDWDMFFNNPWRQTRGRLWPLLSGERGEYELIAGRSAGMYLDTIANTANDGMMARAGLGRPTAARRAVRQGDAFGDAVGVDARPVRATRLVDRCREAVERPSIVACRFQQELCP
jgi:glucoamylase